MNIEIKYTDEGYNFISPQQQAQLNEYYNKYIYENGEIRKIEYYNRKRITRNQNPLWGGGVFYATRRRLSYIGERIRDDTRTCGMAFFLQQTRSTGR